MDKLKNLFVVTSVMAVWTFFLLGLVPAKAAGNTPASGQIKVIKFIGGQIKTSNGTNHTRLSSDCVGSILTGMSTYMINLAMDNLDSVSSSVPSGQVSVASNNIILGNGATSVNLAVNPNPNTGVIILTPEQQQTAIVANTQGQQVVLVTPNVPQSVSQQMVQAERQKQQNQFAVPFSGEATVGIGMAWDTFFVPPGSENSRFESDLDLTWSFSKADLDQYNALLKTNQLVTGLVPIGMVKLETKRSRFVREVGARCDLGIDLKWNKKWHNNIAGINITDLGMEIDEADVDKLGASDVQHSDTMNVSDIPGLVQDIAEKVSTKLASKAGSVAAKEAGDSLAEKIFENMEIGVLVTQTTRDRKATLDFVLTAKDMSGQVMQNITLEPSTVVFDAEGVDHYLSIRIPQGCPPIKSLTLRVSNASYQYKESGNVELGIKAKYIPVELKTGKLTEGIGKYYPSEYDIKARDEDKPSFTITGSNLVYVPFHGIVRSNSDPAFGIAQAKVDIVAKDNSFSRTEYTGPDGKFYGDFYIGSDSGAPATTITASKDGYDARSQVKFINDSEGYDIKKVLPSTKLILVSGTVRDTSGNPLDQAEVHATSGNTDVWVATNSLGYYIFSILKEGEATFSAYKSGYYIPPVSRMFAEGLTNATVDLPATFQVPPGAIKLIFNGTGVSTLQGVHIKRATGAEFNAVVDSDKTATIPCPKTETLTLSANDFTFKPDKVTASFSDNNPGEKKSFNVTISPLWSSSVIIQPPQGTIETGGVMYNDNRLQEHMQLSAIVKDASGQPMNGVTVRFMEVSKTGNAAIQFSKEGSRPGCGYGITDSQGKATIDVVAYNTLGVLTIKAIALDKYIVTGNNSDEVPSANTAQINIVPTTRVSEPVKPTAAVQVYTNSKAVLTSLTPTVEKGGEFIFHLSQTLGDLAGSPLSASGQITSYAIAFSKNNGSWQEETHEGAPPQTIPKTYNEKGNYKVGYKVRKTIGTEQIWSDRAESPFNVVEFVAPELTLNVLNTTATVNVPLNYSFNVNASAPLQSIALTFGDNNLDVILDSGILTGRTVWSVNYHHTYRNEGSYTMCLTATDQNGKTAQISKNITVQPLSALNDNTAPTGSVSISNGASSTEVKGVALQITGEDNSGGSGVYRFRVSNDGTNWSAWNSVDFSDDIPQPSISKYYAWQLSEGSGIKTVYVQLKDAADNVSNTFTDSIQLQAASLQASGSLPPPAVTDTFYNNAPLPRGSISIAARNGNTISANFSATSDWAIAVNQMALSFDSTNWSGWMQFENNKQIDLTGHLDATKLYVTFGDRAGGQSPVYSANIPAAPSQTQASQPVAQQSTQVQATQAQQAVSSGGQAQQARSSAVTTQREGRGDRVISEKSIRTVQTREQLSKGSAGEEIKKEEPVDLSIEGLRFAPDLYIGQKAEVEARIRNNSNTEIRDLQVNFSSEDGTNKKEKLSLRPKARETVKFEWIPLKEGRQKITADLVCKEDVNPANNRISEMADVKGKELIDIFLVDMRLSRELMVGQNCNIEVIAKNDSGSEIGECQVFFETEDGSKGHERVSFRPHAQERINFSWTPRKEGRQKITVKLEYDKDENPRNNILSQAVEVQPIARKAPEDLGLIKERVDKGAPGVIMEKERRREEKEKIDLR